MSTETKPLIFAAMAEVMREIEAVAKNSVNQHQKYNFRGIDAVYNAVHGALSKHGIITPPCVLSCEYEARKTNNGGDATLARLKVEYNFTAVDGSSLKVGPVCSEALDTSDKATNKAMAFAHKYALLQTFCIPTEDVAEGDKETIEVKRGVAAVPSLEKKPAPSQPAPSQGGSPRLKFGKHKGKALSEVEDDNYISWLLDKAKEKVDGGAGSKYHEEDKIWLAAIQYEATRRSFGVQGAYSNGPPPPSDDGIPFGVEP